jgi:hypothetical protein
MMKTTCFDFWLKRRAVCPVGCWFLISPYFNIAPFACLLVLGGIVLWLVAPSHRCQWSVLLDFFPVRE